MCTLADVRGLFVYIKYATVFMTEAMGLDSQAVKGPDSGNV
jgi:hypothetical protein